MKKNARAYVALAILTILVLSRALSAGYVSDDLLLVARNPLVQDPANLKLLLSEPMWGFVMPEGYLQPGYWRPLSGLVLMVGYLLGGGGPLALHAICLAIHVAAVLVAYRLLTVWIGDARLAFLAALLFALHPVQVEPVLWVSAVSDPLSGLLVLIGLASLCQWLDGGGQRQPWATAAWFALALLTKESTIVFPILALLVAWLRGAPESRRALRGLALLLTVAGVYLLVRFLVLGSVLGTDTPVPAPASASAPISSALALLASLVQRLFWLGSWYPVDPDQGTWAVLAGVWALLVGLVLVIAAVSRLRQRGERRMAFGLGWLLITLAPMLALADTIAGDGAGDRFLYLAELGFAVTLVALVGRYRLGPWFLVALIVICGVNSWLESASWQEPLSFAEMRVAQHPQSVEWHYDLGRVLIERSSVGGRDLAEKDADLSRAREELRNCGLLLQRPDPKMPPASLRGWRARVDLGLAYCELLQARNIEEQRRSVRLFQRLAEEHSKDHRVLTGLGMALGVTGDLVGAEKALRRALDIQPSHAEALHNLGRALLQQGRARAAVPYFERALRQNPLNQQTAQLLATARREARLR